ncbi:hypothetical protein V8G54_022508 [Vigna mungo]|uniref:Uncharacterized protein n=1 Tax=Vigna mungo TaxID=3915 RepID=A0AAQ3N3A2_VIGMU
MEKNRFSLTRERRRESYPRRTEVSAKAAADGNGQKNQRKTEADKTPLLYIAGYSNKNKLREAQIHDYCFKKERILLRGMHGQVNYVKNKRAAQNKEHGALSIRTKRASKAKYATTKLSRHIRGNMESMANCVNHLKIKGSSTARRVAGRRGSRIDFSCTKRNTTNLEKKTSKRRKNYSATHKGNLDGWETLVVESLKEDRL